MKLFFTAGTQFRFLRMDDVVRQVARCHPSWQLVYQTGPGADISGMGEFGNLDMEALMAAEIFSSHLRQADLVVTHAGMGNVITCLEWGKPFVMLPRQAAYGEHRNDHQVGSAEAVNRLYAVPVFREADELTKYLCQGKFPREVDDASVQLLQQREAFGVSLQRLIDSL